MLFIATRGNPSRLKLSSLFLMLVLMTWARIFAQTVGPESEIRSSTLPGSALEATAAFETGATYVSWRDTRREGSSGGDIHVQKLGTDGKPLWTVGGLGIALEANTQSLPVVTPDGTGGAVVVWLDERASPRAVYAQRISAAGSVQWSANGVSVGRVYSELPRPFVHRAQDGGFLVTWWDSAPFVGTDKFPVLAQKLNADGVPLWDPGAPDTTDLWGPGLEVVNGITRGRSIPDGAGGIIAFGKLRSDGGFRFQRVRADDSTWAKSIDFAATLPDTVLFNFASDAAGGVIVAFLDNRTVRAVRVAGDGTWPWGAGGITLADSNVVISDAPVVAPDGTGGAWIAWISSTPHDVHVQHVALDGSPLWPAGGAVTPDGSSTEREPAFVSDGAGGLFMAFTTATSLRGQRLNRNGEAKWKVGGSNGVSLMSGVEPMIGASTAGSIVVYRRATGLFARTIDVPPPFQLTDLAILPDNTARLRFTGGVAGRTYDVLRAPILAPLTNIAWKAVGTVQPGQTWTDTQPLPAAAFYGARDPAP